MNDPKREIFRRKALKHYLSGREKNVLPRFISPPMIFSLWMLLGLFLVAGGIAWWGRVPVYTDGVGEVLAPSTQQEGAAVVFLPTDQLSRLHAGQPVLLQIGASGPQVHQAVSSVDAHVMSPAAARQQFGLDGSASLLVTQPAAVILVKLGPTLEAKRYAGSLVRVQVQIGSQRVISLLPVVGSLIGDK